MSHHSTIILILMFAELTLDTTPLQKGCCGAKLASPEERLWRQARETPSRTTTIDTKQMDELVRNQVTPISTSS